MDIGLRKERDSKCEALAGRQLKIKIVSPRNPRQWRTLPSGDATRGAQRPERDRADGKLFPCRAAEAKKAMGYPSLCRILVCGKRGIRTPGASQLNGFQDRRNRPLCHLSGGKSSTLFSFYQIPAGNSPPPSGRAAIAPAALKTAARRAGDTMRNPRLLRRFADGKITYCGHPDICGVFAPGSRHDAEPRHSRRFCRRAGDLRNRKDVGMAYFRKIY